jgi:hypothetical protein
MDAGAAAVVINAEDLMEGAAWDGAAIARLLDAVGMDRLLFEAPHSQVGVYRFWVNPALYTQHNTGKVQSNMLAREALVSVLAWVRSCSSQLGRGVHHCCCC